MLKLVFDNDDNIKIDPCELKKEGISYTVDTLEDLSKKVNLISTFLSSWA